MFKYNHVFTKLNGMKCTIEFVSDYHGIYAIHVTRVANQPKNGDWLLRKLQSQGKYDKLIAALTIAAKKNYSVLPPIK